MYLKAVELSGFKSFVDKTFLNFEPGITAVVGPNGSGKSNISDAVRWVLGEMSAKLLRGAKMEDVIFAGTQKRKPVNFAEVTLSLDNQSRTFPLDFSEITVTRRVYRSGESEYYINRAQCRLKDIHELFMDTGLGRDGYSIIGQGKIDEIVSSKSDERRTIFDEAAGISKFRHRKDEALRKLNATTDNLVRITDITAELENQLEPLYHQSEKAKKYLGLREELKVLEVNAALVVLDKSKAGLAEAGKAFEQVTLEIEECGRTADEAEANAALLSEQIRTLTEQIQECDRQIAEAQVAMKGCQGEIEVLKNSRENSHGEAERLHGEIEGYLLKIEETQQAKAALEAALIEQNALVQSLEQHTGELAKQAEEAGVRLTEQNETIGSLKGDMIEKLNDIAAQKAKISSFEAFKSSFLSRRQTIEKELDAAAGEGARLETLLSETARKLQTAQERYQKLSDQHSRIGEGLSKLKAALADANAQAEAKRNDYQHSLSRLNMLRELERDYEGYAKSVKTVLSAHKSGNLKCGINGALSALIQVEKKVVTAIEIALGGALQNIVVDTPADAKEAIAFLKRTSAGRATFLPVSSVEGRMVENLSAVKTQKGYVGVASELIQYDPKYAGIIKNLLGRTIVVDHIDNGIAMSDRFGHKFKIVTLDGDVFNPGGAMSGGSVNKSTGILSRAGQIRDLTALAEEQRKLAENAKSLAEKTERRIQEENAKIMELSEQIRVIEQELVRFKADQEHGLLLQNAAKTARQTLSQEAEGLQSQIADTNDQIAMMINQSTRDEMDIEEAGHKVAELEKGLGAAQQEREAIGAQLMEQSVALNSAKKDRDVLRERIGSADEDKVEANKAVDIRRAALDELAKASVALDSKEALKAGQIQKLSDEISTLEEKSTALAKQRGDSEEHVKAQNTLAKELVQKVFVLKEEQNRIDNKRTKLQMEVENTSARLWDDYELTYSNAFEYKKEGFQPAAAARRINELRGDIRALGNVNVDAIEEYKSVKERYEFLTTQRNDLESAKESLNKLIEEITLLMEKQFKEQFVILNQNFSRVFEQLFGGGRAELRLSDPANILDSGIEIDAQPPGKKLQSLNLLSGGEKAFTAIALLFAILEVRPTPFCILDEIEAALDEPNVYRFADYLRRYSKRTQFVIVTHRRGTMEAADLLYGVTMQEQGVSKLLSLKIEDVENL